MATILDVKPVENASPRKTEILTFFGVMREKLEFEKLKAMKEVADAKYKVKSFSRQVREIEKNISKIKDGKPIKYRVSEIPAPEPEPQPTIHAPPVLHTTTLFSKPSYLENSPNQPHDIVINRREWKCEKCNDIKPFPNRKLLKLHISELHAY